MTRCVYDFLDEARRSPSMVLGGDDTELDRRHSTLEQMLRGYANAIVIHQLEDPGESLLNDFAEFLWRTRRWPKACGPIVAIRDHSKDAREAYDTFWTLLDEYRRAAQQSK